MEFLLWIKRCWFNRWGQGWRDWWWTFLQRTSTPRCSLLSTSLWAGKQTQWVASAGEGSHYSPTPHPPTLRWNFISSCYHNLRVVAANAHFSGTALLLHYSCKWAFCRDCSIFAELCKCTFCKDSFIFAAANTHVAETGEGGGGQKKNKQKLWRHDFTHIKNSAMHHPLHIWRKKQILHTSVWLWITIVPHTESA